MNTTVVPRGGGRLGCAAEQLQKGGNVSEAGTCDVGAGGITAREDSVAAPGACKNVGWGAGG